MYTHHSNYVWVTTICMLLAACAFAGEPDEGGEPLDNIEVDSVGQSLGPALALGALSAPFTNPASGLCLDVVRASTSPGARVKTHHCNGGSNQNWYYNASNGELRDANSGLCLDVLDGVIEDGRPVQMYTCLGTENQEWRWALNNTLYMFGPGGRKWCLDVPGSATTPTHLQIWSCHGNDNQVWKRPGRTLRNIVSGRCLDVKTQDGYTVQLWDCNGGSNQRWVQEMGVVWRTEFNSRLMIVHDYDGLTLSAGNLPGWPEVIHRIDGTLGLLGPGSPDEFCLDGDNWGEPNGKRAKFVHCDGSAKQIWVVQ